MLLKIVKLRCIYLVVLDRRGEAAEEEVWREEHIHITQEHHLTLHSTLFHSHIECLGAGKRLLREFDEMGLEILHLLGNLYKCQTIILSVFVQEANHRQSNLHVSICHHFLQVVEEEFEGVWTAFERHDDVDPLLGGGYLGVQCDPGGLQWEEDSHPLSHGQVGSAAHHIHLHPDTWHITVPVTPHNTASASYIIHSYIDIALKLIISQSSFHNG